MPVVSACSPWQEGIPSFLHKYQLIRLRHLEEPQAYVGKKQCAKTTWVSNQVVVCDTPQGANALKRLPVTVDVEGVFTPARVSAYPGPLFPSSSRHVCLHRPAQRLIRLCSKRPPSCGKKDRSCCYAASEMC